MRFIKEFKEFAVKGNAMDLAIGVVIGASFGKIVGSMVDDVIMPFVGLLVGGVNFSGLKIVLGRTAEGAVSSSLNYGLFIQRVVDFTIVAFTLFVVVKAMNTIRKKNEPAPPPVIPKTPEDIILLREIRDSLKSKNG